MRTVKRKDKVRLESRGVRYITRALQYLVGSVQQPSCYSHRRDSRDLHEYNVSYRLSDRYRYARQAIQCNVLSVRRYLKSLVCVTRSAEVSNTRVVRRESHNFAPLQKVKGRLGTWSGAVRVGMVGLPLRLERCEAVKQLRVLQWRKHL